MMTASDVTCKDFLLPATLRMYILISFLFHIKSKNNWHKIMFWLSMKARAVSMSQVSEPVEFFYDWNEWRVLKRFSLYLFFYFIYILYIRCRIMFHRAWTASNDTNLSLCVAWQSNKNKEEKEATNFAHFSLLRCAALYTHAAHSSN